MERYKVKDEDGFVSVRDTQSSLMAFIEKEKVAYCVNDFNADNTYHKIDIDALMQLKRFVEEVVLC